MIDSMEVQPAVLDTNSPNSRHPYTFIASQHDLVPLLEDLPGASLVGIDLETTGLNARRDRVRLLTLATVKHTWVVDLFSVQAAEALSQLREKLLVGHNIAFDLRFLAEMGFQAENVQDTLALDVLLHSGEPGLKHSLAEVAQRELGLELSKEMRLSDWTGSLSEDQITYAASDGSVLPPLYRSLWKKAQDAELSAVAEVEGRCLPAVVWMAGAGVPVDVEKWRAVAQAVELEAERLRQEMDRAAPRPLVLDLGFGWNWDKPQEVQEALLAAGCELPNANEETLSSIDHPLALLLREYRENRKLASTYGLNWLKHLDGCRVYPDWRQLGASSGRMACSNPNLQQIPRDRRYRACIAAPPGRVLVKADYSQIELRIAARIAGEDRMIAAYEAGEDLHTLTAQAVLGKGEVSRSDRQLAKAINFGLLYGMGAEGFSRYARIHYGVNLSEEEAARYRNGFFRTYPRLRSWHQSVRAGGEKETRTLTGRRHFLEEDTPLPLRLNLPVQGTGADGLKRALALLWKRRSQCPGAVPIIACHDEIVVECPEEKLEEAMTWLRLAMIDGMAPLIRPVPVEVEVSAGRSWAGE